MGAEVDPLDVADIAAGMRAAAALPGPCQAARDVAERHSIAVSAARIEQLLGEVS